MDATTTSGCDEISDYGSGHDIFGDENNIDIKMETNGKYLLSIRYGEHGEVLEALEQLYANAKRKEVFEGRKRLPLSEYNQNTNPIESKQFKRAYGKFVFRVKYITLIEKYCFISNVLDKVLNMANQSSI